MSPAPPVSAGWSSCSRPTTPRCWGYVGRRPATPEQAADAFSDVFLVAWRRLDDVPAGDEARLWLLGVTRRVLANARRTSRRQTGLTDRLAASLPRSAFVVPPPDEPDGRLRAALAQLAPDDAEFLRLVGWEGLTPTRPPRSSA